MTPNSSRKLELPAELSHTVPRRRFTLSLVAAAVGGVAASFLPIAAIAGVVLGLTLLTSACSSFGPGSKQEPNVEVAPVATITRQSTQVKVSNWNELSGLGDFLVREPGYLPAGVELISLGFYYFSPDGQVKPPTKRNGIVLAQYRGPDGFLLIEQGWGIGLAQGGIPANVEQGVTLAGGLEAVWVRGFWPGSSAVTGSRNPESSYVKLGWRPDPQGETGPGWLISTDYLSLDEITRVAQSLR